MTSLQDLPPTGTVSEAAAILGISRRSAYRAARQHSCRRSNWGDAPGGYPDIKDG